MTAPTATAVPIVPLPLPSLAPRMVQLTNLVVGRHRPLTFKAPSGTCEISFLATLPGYRSVASLALRLGEHQKLQVGLDLFPPMAVLGDSLAGAALENLPAPIQQVLLEAALEEVLNQFSKAARVPVAVEGVNTSAPAAPEGPAIFFELRDGSGAKVLAGHLPGDVATWEWLAGLLAKQPVGRARPCASIPVSYRVELGRTRLPVREFADLALNDVVLIDDCLDPLRRCWIVLAPEIRFEAELANRAATILNMATDTAANGPAPGQSEPGASAPGLKLEELPVQLVFEAGEKQISFGELKSLKPGFTFELDASPSRPLTIRANGRVIGTGELVQIGDKTGVRILELGA